MEVEATRLRELLSKKGTRTPDSFHRELGQIMWDECGMSRTQEGLDKAIGKIQALREEFHDGVKVTGAREELNFTLEKAGRVADFLEHAEVMCRDAAARQESCGGHFREEYQTPEGEAVRDDEGQAHVSVWEYQGRDQAPVMHKEDLSFEFVTPTTRSYK